MKNTKTFILKRQEAILKYLEENNFAKTEELAKFLNTSNVTIRRDFQILEEKGLIIRNHGGAQVSQNILNKKFCDNATNKNEILKSSIAKKAAEFIENNDIIFINSSSTAINFTIYW